MKKAICSIFDSKYFSQGRHALESAKRHNPSHTTVLLTDNVDNKIADIQLTPKDIGLPEENWLTVGRVAIVEFLLQNLNFDTTIFIDGDTFIYNSFDNLQYEAENNNMVVIPHITKPIPNDNHGPQNRTISLSGNYNTGVWGASKGGLSFIKWWREQTLLFPILRPDWGFVNEQGWLRFVGDFEEKTKIFRHPGYNVAYWNIKQRFVEYNNDSLFIDGEKLCIMHFSGLNRDIDPHTMSVFQDRFFLHDDDIVYKIYKDYYDLIWT
jgi:hypothetical protein